MNPFTVELRALKEEHDQAQSELDQWQKQLVWHQGFSIDKANLDLRQALAAADAANKQLQQSRDDGRALVAAHAAQEAKSRMGMDPRYWFSAERGIAKGQAAESLKLLADQATRVQQLEFEAMTEAQVVRSRREVLTLAREFDPLLAHAASLALLETVERIGPQVEVLQRRSDDLDDQLRELLEKVSSEKAIGSRMRERMARAAGFAARLASRASSRSDRYQIHEQCGRELGTRYPEEEMKKCERELGRVERTLTKLHDKIDQIVRFATHDIRHIVIDGNNLSYANGNEWIGLSALKVLVPVLEKKYRITLFFDSSIRRGTGLSKQQIEAEFPSAVEVHIVANKNVADNSILALAEENQNAFVLSGDRYVEFPSHLAGKGKRLIQHETLRGFTHIPAMNISAKFEAEPRHAPAG